MSKDAYPIIEKQEDWSDLIDYAQNYKFDNEQPYLDDIHKRDAVSRYKLGGHLRINEYLRNKNNSDEKMNETINAISDAMTPLGSTKSVFRGIPNVVLIEEDLQKGEIPIDHFYSTSLNPRTALIFAKTGPNATLMNLVLLPETEAITFNSEKEILLNKGQKIEVDDVHYNIPAPKVFVGFEKIPVYIQGTVKPGDSNDNKMQRERVIDSSLHWKSAVDRSGELDITKDPSFYSASTNIGLRQYTAKGYYYMNHYLRTGDWGEGNIVRPEYIDDISTLMTPLNYSQQVYRGTASYDDIGKEIEKGEIPINFFYSTSRHPGTALKFSHPPKPVFFDLYVPPGVEAISMPGESETLLNKGQKIKIEDVSEDVDMPAPWVFEPYKSKLYVQGTVIPSDDPTPYQLMMEYGKKDDFDGLVKALDGNINLADYLFDRYNKEFKRKDIKMERSKHTKHKKMPAPELAKVKTPNFNGRKVKKRPAWFNPPKIR